MWACIPGSAPSTYALFSHFRTPPQVEPGLRLEVDLPCWKGYWQMSKPSRQRSREDLNFRSFCTKRASADGTKPIFLLCAKGVSEGFRKESFIPISALRMHIRSSE